MQKATVYFTKEITSASLQKIFHALGVTLPGKVAVKISTGAGIWTGMVPC